MRRSIEISTDVFAAIWAIRQEGEESEDEILRRVLNEKHPQRRDETANSNAGGVFDVRNDVQFEEGFEVFRNYKNKQYRATATAGAWIRQDTGQAFPSLSALNQTIVAGNENIWNGNWKFLESDGRATSINALRKR